MPETVAACVALGSNLDDPRAQVRRGFEALASLPRTVLGARSRLYLTPPWGVRDQPDFINAVARLETSLSPRGLLEALLDVETRAGRVRGVRNGPRTRLRAAAAGRRRARTGGAGARARQRPSGARRCNGLCGD